jgi:hypothetical protein
VQAPVAPRCLTNGFAATGVRLTSCSSTEVGTEGEAGLFAVSAIARPPADGFKLSTIELGIRIVASRSLVVS